MRLGGPLRGYELPPPGTGPELIKAVQASLRLIAVAPDPISLPLFAAIWRAPLGSTDFGLHLSGATGVFKSEIAALTQRHFGARMDRLHLPGSWQSTANALEKAASDVADALFTGHDGVRRDEGKG